MLTILESFQDGLGHAGLVPGANEIARQTRSGTPFDPAPQFWVDRIDVEDEKSVIGRCWFGPVRRAMVVDVIATKHGESWDCRPCDLRIEAVEVFRRMTRQIDQNFSGRLTLAGAVPADVEDAVLVCRAAPSIGLVLKPDECTGIGLLWVREPT